MDGLEATMSVVSGKLPWGRRRFQRVMEGAKTIHLAVPVRSGQGSYHISRYIWPLL